MEDTITSSMPDIANQRCHNHGAREAVARCPECGRFFCRECITEHEDKVLCAFCLRRRSGPAPTRSHRLRWVFRLGHFLLGMMVLYLLFYYCARILLTLPAAFHEGTLWQSGWWTGS
jgi:hypothetical protein